MKRHAGWNRAIGPGTEPACGPRGRRLRAAVADIGRALRCCAHAPRRLPRRRRQTEGEPVGGGAVDERDHFAEASAGVAALVDYFRALLHERERDPRDDLTSLMLRAEHEGDHLTHDEVIANCILLLFAGHETTTNLIGNGLFHLLRHPAEAELVHTDPALLHAAVEELLRYPYPPP
jgi:cytochrome P450